jgi:hypothetical protein
MRWIEAFPTEVSIENEGSNNDHNKRVVDIRTRSPSEGSLFGGQAIVTVTAASTSVSRCDLTIEGIKVGGVYELITAAFK